MPEKTNTPDEGIKYPSGVFVRIEGREYPIRIDSVEVFAKATEMQNKLSDYVQEINSDPAVVVKITATIQDFILMMLGEDAYKSIFNTEEKRDNWRWHLEVFAAIFSKTIDFKSQSFTEIVNSPIIKQLKEINLQNSKKTAGKAKKHV